MLEIIKKDRGRRWYGTQEVRNIPRGATDGVTVNIPLIGPFNLGLFTHN
jgi:hypothetical protein